MIVNDKRILIVIPAFNEQESIERTLQGVTTLDVPWDVLVVDDGSLDQTALKAKGMGAAVLSLPFNIGIGGAVSLGLMYAQRKGYDAVVRLDADGQHDPRYISDVLKPVLDKGIDLCIGSRFTGIAQGFQSSFFRRTGILFFARLISALTGETITDPTSGFNAFGQRAIQLFTQAYPSDYPEPEAIVIAKRSGLTVQEVPVQMNTRTAGLSSIRYLRTLYYMMKVTLAVIMNYLKPSKS